MEASIRLALHELDTFDFDAAYPFSARLARENGWSKPFAARVVAEYRRFLRLARTTAHPVTPSEAVDQAWHLHILQTEAYRRFCSQVLGRQLDHGPSRGGPRERARFRRDYERTLASYEREFGEPPPADIWPSSVERFSVDAQPRRVSAAEHWIVPKPRAWRWAAAGLKRRARAPAASYLPLCALAAAACVAGSDDRGVSGADFLLIYLCLWFASIAAAMRVRRRALHDPADAREPPELEPYEAAQLARGERVAVDAALVSLVATGHVGSDDLGRELRALRDLPDTAPRLERDLHREVAARPMSLAEVRAAAAELTRPIDERLRALGLVTRTPRAALWLALAAPIIGSLRIASRLGSDRPIAFLVLLTLGGFVLALTVFRPREVRTRLGESALARVRAEGHTLDTSAPVSELAHAGTLPVVAASFGLDGFDCAGLPTWASQQLSRRDASAADAGGGPTTSFAGSSDGDAGDGGGGCGGGGCGGCGGCGG